MNKRAVPYARRRQSGLSLVELMVALVLGTLLIAGVANLAMQISRNHSELEQAGRQVENGRYAVGLLADEIQHAGYFGQLAEHGDLPTALPDPCATSQGDLLDAMPLFIHGYDAPTGAPLDCLPDGAHLDGTDVLVVRRASTTTTPIDELEAGRMYLQATPAQFRLNTAPKENFELTKRDGVTPAELRAYRVDIYFVGPCRDGDPETGVCDATSDNGRPIPTLKRLELTTKAGAREFRIVPLAEGIENLQIDYGIDRDGDGQPNPTDDAAGDTYIKAPSLAQWGDVVALRVHVLSRAPSPSAGHEDKKTYTLGLAGTVGPFNDAYRRHLFASTARAINRSSRREEP